MLIGLDVKNPFASFRFSVVFKFYMVSIMDLSEMVHTLYMFRLISIHVCNTQWNTFLESIYFINKFIFLVFISSNILYR